MGNKNSKKSSQKYQNNQAKINDEIKIKGYHIKKVLGEGSEGIVYLAEQDARQYAIKVIQICSNIKKNSLERQVKIMRDLSSQFILPVRDCFFYFNQQEEFFCIVSQKCQASLEQIFMNFSQAQKIKISQQLIEAVAFMHSKGFVHRDLKPQNVLYIHNKIKIADFGTSKALIDYFNSEVGTRYYHAKQILQGKTCNFKVDSWSLGLIILQLWLGVRLCNIRKGLPPLIEGFPSESEINCIRSKELKQVVGKFLIKDQEYRIEVRQGLKIVKSCSQQNMQNYFLVEDQFYNKINEKLKDCPLSVTHLTIRQSTN